MEGGACKLEINTFVFVWITTCRLNYTRNHSKGLNHQLNPILTHTLLFFYLPFYVCIHLPHYRISHVYSTNTKALVKIVATSRKYTLGHVAGITHTYDTIFNQNICKNTHTYAHTLCLPPPSQATRLKTLLHWTSEYWTTKEGEC